jgi:hypothetical protein
MEKMTFVFLIIIVAYLLFAFIKSRGEKGKKKEEVYCAPQAPQPQQKQNSSETERAAIAAAIAAVMGETSFVLKRVYAVATVDESRSNWRTAGRTEIMTRKVF